MITEYFKWRQSLTRLLATPAGPHLSAISEGLKAQGFSYWILRKRLQGAAHLVNGTSARGGLSNSYMKACWGNSRYI